MKIGLFTDSYPPYINGVATSVENLRNALTSLGYTVYVVTVNNSLINVNYDEKERILKIPGIPTKIYNYRFSNIYSRKAMHIIKGWNIDIIHTHTEFGIGIFARTIAKKFNIPLVHTYHTLYEDYTHYVTHGYFDKYAKNIVKRLTKYFCVKTANYTIVPTDKIYRLFKDSYNIKDNLSIVPSGINLDKFLGSNIKEINDIKKKYNIKKSDFVIVFVGRLASEKNIEFLINCHKKIINKSGLSVKLLIVGDGPDKNKYMDLVNNIGISDNVIFTGAIDQKNIQNYYHLGNIFVTASKTETQGLTVIEAISSNLFPFCINDKAFTSFLPSKCIFNDEEDYINKICNYINKNNKEYNQTKLELNSIIDKFSSKTYALNVLNIYKRIVNKDF